MGPSQPDTSFLAEPVPGLVRIIILLACRRSQTHMDVIEV
jgi:hypothetical protein